MTVENCKANFLRAFEFFRPATLKKVMKGGDKWGIEFVIIQIGGKPKKAVYA